MRELDVSEIERSFTGCHRPAQRSEDLIEIADIHESRAVVSAVDEEFRDLFNFAASYEREAEMEASSAVLSRVMADDSHSTPVARPSRSPRAVAAASPVLFKSDRGR